MRSLIEAFLHDAADGISFEFSARMETLAANVALWGSKMNLTAHPHDPEEIAFHMIDSVMPVILANAKQSHLNDVFDVRRKILDLGSGGGFPGLVLAAASPAHFTLVESRRKRASFLRVATAEMGLKNVTIEGKRAEDIGLAGQFALVMARAFGDPAYFFRLAKEALRPGGLAMLYANPSQRAALRNYEILEYEVSSRGRAKVSRILGIYRQAVEESRTHN